MLNKNSKIYIAGINGMVGSACLRKFKLEGFKNIYGLSSKELDLTDNKSVKKIISKIKPDIIIDAAAKVGGILANNEAKFEFLNHNLRIQLNLIESALSSGVKTFVFLGSSCIYPKFANQPIKEEELLSGKLESTNEGYALAKICGLKSIEYLKNDNLNYYSLMPTNLYGENDNFDQKTSHVIPGMISKFHKAKISNLKSVTLWGDGSPRREFMYVDDLADAIFFSLKNKLTRSFYNVGVRHDISIKELATKISKITGFNGEIKWDNSKPNGTPQKLMDSSKFYSFGYDFKYNLDKGLLKTYKYYLNSIHE